MHLALLAILLVLMLIFIEIQLVWAVALTALLIIADLFGGILSKFLSGFGTAFGGAKEVAKAEFEDIENSKPNPPSGKKIFKKGFSAIGEGIGKGVRATKENKNITQNPGLFSFTGNFADKVMDGIQKLFK